VNPLVSPWNCHARSPARVINDFIDFVAGTQAAFPLHRFERITRRTKSMKRTTVALAIVLSSMLLTGLASLASATLKPGQDIQAPRTGSEDIQSPRG
jgi:hypothetical protein